MRRIFLPLALIAPIAAPALADAPTAPSLNACRPGAEATRGGGCAGESALIDRLPDSFFRDGGGVGPGDSEAAVIAWAYVRGDGGLRFATSPLARVRAARPAGSTTGRR